MTIYFQPKVTGRSMEIIVTSDPKIALLTNSYHAFIVDVDAGKVIRKLNSVLPKYSKGNVVVTKRNGNVFLEMNITLKTPNTAAEEDILKYFQEQTIHISYYV